MLDKRLNFCFKIGCPRRSELYKWGDFYFAQSFGEELQRKGHEYSIQILPQWHTNADSGADVVIHFRGLTPYNVKPNHFNIMWVISHPSDISVTEYSKYDLILVASLAYAEELKAKLSTPVYTLLQFVDPSIFYNEVKLDLKSELLFVGNSRGVMRRIVKDIIPPPRDLKVYGTAWEEFLPKKYIANTWYPNEKLRQLYSSCDILLNDHWDDMKKYGFINNRVFDALACKTVLINDDFEELHRVFPGILSYSNRQELLKLIKEIYSNREKYTTLAKDLYEIIIEKHTVEKRVAEFLVILENYSERLNRASNVSFKVKVRDLILRYVGYGKIYIFAQRQYQRLKELPRYKARLKRVITKFSEKIINRISPMAGLKSTINYCDEADIKALARRISRVFLSGKDSLVSIIIPNKNGVEYLQDLMTAMQVNTLYKAYEVIVVDNQSKDGSVRYLKGLGWENLRVIETGKDLSFSQSVNLGAEEARGEYLVLLNNDTVPLYGWLDELLATINKHNKCGVVGSRLIYPAVDGKGKHGELIFPGCSIQHDGIGFKLGTDEVIPYNLGKNGHPLLEMRETESVLPAVTAACLLVPRDIFRQVDGFDENYLFGREDVDFCLKVGKLGNEIILNRNSLLLHKEFSTQVKTSINMRKGWRNNNSIVFHNKWFDYLHYNLWSEKIYGKTPFWAECRLHIGFLVTEYSPDTTAGDLFSARGLGNHLERLFNYKITYLPRRPLFEWDKVPDSVDILISMRHDYDIRDSITRSGTLKIAWIRGYIEDWLNKPWIKDYDGIIVSSSIGGEMVIKTLGNAKLWGIVPLAALDHFNDPDCNESRDIDVAFVGNIFGVPRDVVSCLDLSQGFNFHFYGRLEGGPNHPWLPYHQGTICHSDLPALYRRSKIVIEDTAPFNTGTVNLRVYEAAACGALVIANQTPGIEEVFEEGIVFYQDKHDLTTKIKYYLSHEQERKRLADAARNIVNQKHRFSHRAETFKHLLIENVLSTKEMSR